MHRACSKAGGLGSVIESYIELLLPNVEVVTFLLAQHHPPLLEFDVTPFPKATGSISNPAAKFRASSEGAGGTMKFPKMLSGG